MPAVTTTIAAAAAAAADVAAGSVMLATAVASTAATSTIACMLLFFALHHIIIDSRRAVSHSTAAGVLLGAVGAPPSAIQNSHTQPSWDHDRCCCPGCHPRSHFSPLYTRQPPPRMPDPAMRRDV